MGLGQPCSALVGKVERHWEPAAPSALGTRPSGSSAALGRSLGDSSPLSLLQIHAAACVSSSASVGWGSVMLNGDGLGRDAGASCQPLVRDKIFISMKTVSLDRALRESSVFTQKSLVLTSAGFQAPTTPFAGQGTSGSSVNGPS